MADLVLVGLMLDGSSRFACIAPETRETEPCISERRLAAVLHPYKEEQHARMALLDAGAAVVQRESGRG